MARVGHNMNSLISLWISRVAAVWFVFGSRGVVARISVYRTLTSAIVNSDQVYKQVAVRAGAAVLFLRTEVSRQLVKTIFRI